MARLFLVSVLAALSLLCFQAQPSAAAPIVTRIASGVQSQFSVFVMSDGSLWGMGANSAGQLGLGDNVGFTNLPTPIISSNVIAVAGGQSYTLFLMSNHSLWGMGSDYDGQLGDGLFFSRQYVPEQIVTGGVNAFAAGDSFSLYGEWPSPLSRGSLWAMGNNEHGQLGDGTTTTTNIPQEILSSVAFGSPAVTAIAAGSIHTLFIRPGGSLWTMGYNTFGQLGDGTINEAHVPEEIVASNVIAIAAGYAHSLFVTSDGGLWGMGYNSDGQLGDGTIVESHVPEQIVAGNVVAVAAGQQHSLFIKSDGSLWGMGNNASGQLGLGRAVPYTNVPVQIVASNVIAAAAGAVHSLFIKSDGSLWGMGNGNVGQLGDPRIFTNNMLSPFQIVPPTPVLNGGFESGDFSFWYTNGNVSQTYITTKGAFIHSGKYGAQLGPIGSLGYLSQTVRTIPGTNYVLSFWLKSPDGETPNEFSVSWNGAVLFDQTNLPAVGWTNVLLAVTATGSTATLQFGFRNDNSYFGIDDVNVVALVPPIITSIAPTGTDLLLDADNGQAGVTYLTLTSTNLTLPLNQWIPVATNVAYLNGHFTIVATNAIGPRAQQQFFVLRMPD